jgi:hypothetical protein
MHTGLYFLNRPLKLNQNKKKTQGQPATYKSAKPDLFVGLPIFIGMPALSEYRLLKGHAFHILQNYLLLSLESVLIYAILVSFYAAILCFIFAFTSFITEFFLNLMSIKTCFQYNLVWLCSIDVPYFRNVQI